MVQVKAFARSARATRHVRDERGAIMTVLDSCRGVVLVRYKNGPAGLWIGDISAETRIVRDLDRVTAQTASRIFEEIQSMERPIGAL